MNKLIALAIVVGLAPMAFADGNSASATAQSSVTILAPVKVTTAGTLNFGKVVVSGATTISISENAVVSGDANSVPFNGQNQITATVPTFTITKDAGAHVAVVFTPTFEQGGVLTVAPAVINNTNNFAASDGTALTNQKLYGTLQFSTLPTYGVINGSIMIAANYI